MLVIRPLPTHREKDQQFSFGNLIRAGLGPVEGAHALALNDAIIGRPRLSRLLITEPLSSLAPFGDNLILLALGWPWLGVTAK